MNQHDRKFLPFDISIISNKQEVLKNIANNNPVRIKVDDKKLFTLVTGMPASENSSWFRKDAIKYDEEFSKLTKSVLALQYGNTERNVHTLLNKGIKNIVEERFVL